MELEDCAYPTLDEIRCGSDPLSCLATSTVRSLSELVPVAQEWSEKTFSRRMELFFQKQGQALDRSAKRDVKVLVVGNPCNTTASSPFTTQISLSQSIRCPHQA